MLTLYDAARCPYCARVRIVLAEKRIAYDPVEIDLGNRPRWLYEKNPSGRVPVLEEGGGFVLPESRVIMEYLEERFPDPPLLPLDPADRALVRLLCERFDELATPYYDLLWKRPGASPARLHDELARLDRGLAARPYLAGAVYTLADIAYVPWIQRAKTRLHVDVESYPSLAGWLARLEERPAIAAERDLVAAA